MTPAKHNETQQPTLKAYLDNELSLWRRFAVRLHLARCASCREELRAMQQIGTELRGQTSTIDPLDPGLRSRILAAVREMTPEPAPSVPSRRPLLIWGGAAFAALLLVAVFASRPRFAADMEKGVASMAPSASTPATAKPAQPAYAPQAAGKSAGESFASDSAGAVQPKAEPERPVSGSMAAKQKSPQLRAARKAESIDSAFGSSSRPQNSLSTLLPESRNVAGNRVAAGVDKVVLPPTVSSGGRSAAGGGRRAPRGRQAVAVVSPRKTDTAGDALMVDRVGASQQRVVLERAGFDLNGYQFVALSGQRIGVPFKKSLDAVRFARATDGKMALDETVSSPILYLSPADSLVNDAAPGSRWQPLPPNIISTQPLFVRPAPDWEQFMAMRWYPNMSVVGGLASSRADDAFALLSGSHVQIGTTLYPDFAAYRAFADAHPDALRLHAVYSNADTPMPAAAHVMPGAPPQVPGASPANAPKASAKARGKSHP